MVDVVEKSGGGTDDDYYICNICFKEITDHRIKCLNCSNYDLCCGCFFDQDTENSDEIASHRTKEHIMVKLPVIKSLSAWVNVTPARANENRDYTDELEDEMLILDGFHLFQFDVLKIHDHTQIEAHQIVKVLSRLFEDELYKGEDGSLKRRHNLEDEYFSIDSMPELHIEEDDDSNESLQVQSGVWNHNNARVLCLESAKEGSVASQYDAAYTHALSAYMTMDAMKSVSKSLKKIQRTLQLTSRIKETSTKDYLSSIISDALPVMSQSPEICTNKKSRERLKIKNSGIPSKSRSNNSAFLEHAFTRVSSPFICASSDQIGDHSDESDEDPGALELTPQRTTGRHHVHKVNLTANLSMDFASNVENVSSGVSDNDDEGNPNLSSLSTMGPKRKVGFNIKNTEPRPHRSPNVSIRRPRKHHEKTGDNKEIDSNNKVITHVEENDGDDASGNGSIEVGSLVQIYKGMYAQMRGLVCSFSSSNYYVGIFSETGPESISRSRKYSQFKCKSSYRRQGLKLLQWPEEASASTLHMAGHASSGTGNFFPKDEQYLVDGDGTNMKGNGFDDNGEGRITNIGESSRYNDTNETLLAGLVDTKMMRTTGIKRNIESNDHLTLHDESNVIGSGIAIKDIIAASTSVSTSDTERAQSAADKALGALRALSVLTADDALVSHANHYDDDDDDVSNLSSDGSDLSSDEEDICITSCRPSTTCVGLSPLIISLASTSPLSSTSNTNEGYEAQSTTPQQINNLCDNNTDDNKETPQQPLLDVFQQPLLPLQLPSTWVCTDCTFSNPYNLRRCNACSKVRLKAVVCPAPTSRELSSSGDVCSRVRLKDVVHPAPTSSELSSSAPKDKCTKVAQPVTSHTPSENGSDDDKDGIGGEVKTKINHPHYALKCGSIEVGSLVQINNGKYARMRGLVCSVSSSNYCVGIFSETNPESISHPRKYNEFNCKSSYSRKGLTLLQWPEEATSLTLHMDALSYANHCGGDDDDDDDDDSGSDLSSDEKDCITTCRSSNACVGLSSPVSPLSSLSSVEEARCNAEQLSISCDENYDCDNKLLLKGIFTVDYNDVGGTNELMEVNDNIIERLPLPEEILSTDVPYANSYFCSNNNDESGNQLCSPMIEDRNSEVSLLFPQDTSNINNEDSQLKPANGEYPQDSSVNEESPLKLGHDDDHISKLVETTHECEMVVTSILTTTENLTFSHNTLDNFMTPLDTQTAGLVSVLTGFESTLSSSSSSSSSLSSPSSIMLKDMYNITSTSQDNVFQDGNITSHFQDDILQDGPLDGPVSSKDLKTLFLAAGNPQFEQRRCFLVPEDSSVSSVSVDTHSPPLCYQGLKNQDNAMDEGSSVFIDTHIGGSKRPREYNDEE